MLLIPELELVVILPPRTGSGTLRRAIAAKFPKTIALYRHMEADGVPHGYTHWKKMGFIRDPLERLFSLWQFCLHPPTDQPECWRKNLQDSTKGKNFTGWVTQNMVPFTNQYDSSGAGRLFPFFTVLHSMPETRKPQAMYLRPDLGTKVIPYERLGQACKSILDIDLDDVPRTNLSPVHFDRSGFNPGALETLDAHVQKWLHEDVRLRELALREYTPRTFSISN